MTENASQPMAAPAPTPPPAVPVAKVAPSIPSSAPSAPQKIGGGFFNLGHESTENEIKVFQHSRIFYWWPVWLTGFIFAAMSYFGGYVVGVVPEGTISDTQLTYIEESGPSKREALVLPAKKKLPTRFDADTNSQIPFPLVAHIAPYRGLGTLFCLILLLVIVFTTMAFRGLLSVFLTVSLVGLLIIFWLVGWLEILLTKAGQLSIYITAGGYLLISLVMFALWAVNLFILDKRAYIVFTPGQVRVKLEFGSGEIAYSSAGLSVHKMRGDFIRHWVLGLGSGDIDIHLQALGRPLEIHNVLGATRVVKEIERIVSKQLVIHQAKS